MGYLSEGKALIWDNSKPHLQKIKCDGLKQFFYNYKKTKQYGNYPFKFGDEIEYTIYTIDHDKKTTSISIDADKVIEKLNDDQCWHPEYAKYMVEGLPRDPYGDSLEDLLKIEPQLNSRREKLANALSQEQVTCTITCFPRLGCYGSSPISSGNEPYSLSTILSDETIGNHTRFHTLTENIRLRRGSKVISNVPMFEQINKSIEMDCMAFGMGCSCLQETIQVSNELDARYLYDQLAIVAPLMLCLTAASPAYRGFLSEVDCRWDVISNLVDDRTPEELNYIHKSRYSSISVFLGHNSEKYNDYGFLSDPVIDQLINEKVLDKTIDNNLAKHLNYLFIRDPLVIYENDTTTNSSDDSDNIDETFTNKYENIHSTNWNTVRFKIPQSDQCGWRVEFRPMELQCDDFSNTSFLVFVSLLARAILKYQPDWYVPISKVDFNMFRSQKRDAINSQVFYFKNKNGEITEQSITEIFEKNINPLIDRYLKEHDNEQVDITKYINYVKNRANKTNPTDAWKIRNFIINHPKYLKDSYISNEICYDLMKNMFLQ